MCVAGTVRVPRAARGCSVRLQRAAPRGKGTPWDPCGTRRDATKRRTRSEIALRARAPHAELSGNCPSGRNALGRAVRLALGGRLGEGQATLWGVAPTLRSGVEAGLPRTRGAALPRPPPATFFRARSWPGAAVLARRHCRGFLLIFGWRDPAKASGVPISHCMRQRGRGPPQPRGSQHAAGPVVWQLRHRPTEPGIAGLSPSAARRLYRLTGITLPLRSCLARPRPLRGAARQLPRAPTATRSPAQSRPSGRAFVALFADITVFGDPRYLLHTSPPAARRAAGLPAPRPCRLLPRPVAAGVLNRRSGERGITDGLPGGLPRGNRWAVRGWVGPTTAPWQRPAVGMGRAAHATAATQSGREHAGRKPADGRPLGRWPAESQGLRSMRRRGGWRPGRDPRSTGERKPRKCRRESGERGLSGRVQAGSVSGVAEAAAPNRRPGEPGPPGWGRRAEVPGWQAADLTPSGRPAPDRS